MCTFTLIQTTAAQNKLNEALLNDVVDFMNPHGGLDFHEPGRRVGGSGSRR